MKLVPVATNVEAALALEWLASEPYGRFVYESVEEGKALARFVLEQSAGEVAAGSLVQEDDGDAVMGLLVMLDGAELRSARSAAAMAMARAKKIDPRGSVRDRMFLAGDTLMEVAPAELYLSRIAVDPAFRRRGIAAALMQRFEAEGRARGSTRLVLEVARESADAIALYERCGFGGLGVHETTDPDTGRVLAYCHMAKPLS